MPEWLAVLLVTIALITLAIAMIALFFGIKLAIVSSERWKGRVYRIQGFPKMISLGNQQIPIFLHLGETCFLGRVYVDFVKQKGSGVVSRDDLITVSLDSSKGDYKSGVHKKGSTMQLVLDINAKSNWKGWLKIGFATESIEIHYVHLPIIVQ